MGSLLFYDVFALAAGGAAFLADANEYANVPAMAMPDPRIVLRSMASENTIALTTIIMTRLAVFRTEDVTAPNDAVNPNAHSLYK